MIVYLKGKAKTSLTKLNKIQKIYRININTNFIMMKLKIVNKMNKKIILLTLTAIILKIRKQVKLMITK